MPASAAIRSARGDAFRLRPVSAGAPEAGTGAAAGATVGAAARAGADAGAGTGSAAGAWAPAAGSSAEMSSPGAPMMAMMSPTFTNWPSAVMSFRMVPFV